MKFLAFIILLFVVLGCNSDYQPPPKTSSTPVRFVESSTPAPLVKSKKNAKKGAKTSTPEKVERQCAGASALCRDGTCSYSASRRGTCSRHGGVAIWNP